MKLAVIRVAMQGLMTHVPQYQTPAHTDTYRASKTSVVLSPAAEMGDPLQYFEVLIALSVSLCVLNRNKKRN